MVKNSEFDFQYKRLQAAIYEQGADLGETSVAFQQIAENNREQWYTQWSNLGHRVYMQGRESEAKGRYISAREAYMRASNYYRAAYFFLRDNLNDPKLVSTWQEQADIFARAIQFFDHPTHILEIPYASIALPGYLFTVDAQKKARPTVIYPNGQDSTKEELYFFGVKALLRRGYNVIVFDGPGQSNILFTHKLYFRPDYEIVLNTVIDYCKKFPEVDSSNIILLGRSYGSYLCLRAAASNNTIAACIADPGQWNLGEGLLMLFPSFVSEAVKQQHETPQSKQFINQMLDDPIMAFKIKSRMLAYGYNDPFQFLIAVQHFTLEAVAQNITCPVLVCNAEYEPFAAGQAEQLFQVLPGPKEYISFKANEGAGEHCEIGASSLFYQRAFDWLDTVIKI